MLAQPILMATRGGDHWCPGTSSNILIISSDVPGGSWAAAAQACSTDVPSKGAAESTWSPAYSQLAPPAGVCAELIKSPSSLVQPSREDATFTAPTSTPTWSETRFDTVTVPALASLQSAGPTGEKQTKSLAATTQLPRDTGQPAHRISNNKERPPHQVSWVPDTGVLSVAGLCTWGINANTVDSIATTGVPAANALMLSDIGEQHEGGGLLTATSLTKSATPFKLRHKWIYDSDSDQAGGVAEPNLPAQSQLAAPARNRAEQSAPPLPQPPETIATYAAPASILNATRLSRSATPLRLRPQLGPNWNYEPDSDEVDEIGCRKGSPGVASIPALPQYEHPVAIRANRMWPPAALRHDHLASRTATSPSQVIFVCVFKSQPGPLQVANTLRGKCGRLFLSGVDRTQINHKQLLGWSVLPAPPTGTIVQQGGQPFFQQGPSQPLQGPLFCSKVLVAHTADLPAGGLDRPTNATATVKRKARSDGRCSGKRPTTALCQTEHGSRSEQTDASSGQEDISNNETSDLEGSRLEQNAATRNSKTSVKGNRAGKEKRKGKINLDDACDTQILADNKIQGSPGLVTPQYKCALKSGKMRLLAQLQQDHLPTLTAADSPTQLLMSFSYKGQEGSAIHPVCFTYYSGEYRWTITGYSCGHRRNRVIVGWSVLPAPPTGTIVQQADKPYYQPGPDQSLQGPLFCSKVLVVHTEDRSACGLASPLSAAAPRNISCKSNTPARTKKQDSSTEQELPSSLSAPSSDLEDISGEQTNASSDLEDISSEQTSASSDLEYSSSEQMDTNCGQEDISSESSDLKYESLEQKHSDPAVKDCKAGGDEVKHNMIQGPSSLVPTLASPQYKCSSDSRQLQLLDQLRWDHLPSLTTADSPTQLLMSFSDKGQAGSSIHPVWLKHRKSNNRWFITGYPKGYRMNKVIVGWSILPAPPTGAIVQQGGRPFYQLGPDQTLHGPLFTSLVLVAHTAQSPTGVPGSQTKTTDPHQRMEQNIFSTLDSDSECISGEPMDTSSGQQDISSDISPTDLKGNSPAQKHSKHGFTGSRAGTIQGKDNQDHASNAQVHVDTIQGSPGCLAPQYECLMRSSSGVLRLLAQLRRDHLPTLTTADSPTQLLIAFSYKGQIDSSICPIHLNYRGIHNGWSITRLPSGYQKDKVVVGWSVLPAPPTGAIMQQGGQSFYQSGPGQPLQGPVFCSKVLVAHTEDLPAGRPASKPKATAPRRWKAQGEQSISAKRNIAALARELQRSSEHEDASRCQEDINSESSDLEGERSEQKHGNPGYKGNKVGSDKGQADRCHTSDALLYVDNLQVPRQARRPRQGQRCSPSHLSTWGQQLWGTASKNGSSDDTPIPAQPQYEHRLAMRTFTNLYPPALLRHAQLGSRTASSPSQLIFVCVFKGQPGPVQVVNSRINKDKYCKLCLTGVDRTHINHKQLLGWSVLAAPPTGAIVQHGGQPFYQPAPDEPLQGPLFTIKVLVAHTEDMPADAAAIHPKTTAPHKRKKQDSAPTSESEYRSSEQTDASNGQQDISSGISPSDLKGNSPAQKHSKHSVKGNRAGSDKGRAYQDHASNAQVHVDSLIQGSPGLVPALPPPQYTCSVSQGQLRLLAQLQRDHLPTLTTADSPIQLLMSFWCKGQEGSAIHPVWLTHHKSNNRWSISGYSSGYRESKIIMGWSLLPAPPTGDIVQQDGHPYYQPGPGQPLQGPLFSSLVLVAHTVDRQSQSESDTGRSRPHVLGREGDTRDRGAIDGELSLNRAALIDPTLSPTPATVTHPTLPLQTATLTPHAIFVKGLPMLAPLQALDLPDGDKEPLPADPIIHPPPRPKPCGREAAMAAYMALSPHTLHKDTSNGISLGDLDGHSPAQEHCKLRFKGGIADRVEGTANHDHTSNALVHVDNLIQTFVPSLPPLLAPPHYKCSVSSGELRLLAQLQRDCLSGLTAADSPIQLLMAFSCTDQAGSPIHPVWLTHRGRDRWFISGYPSGYRESKIIMGWSVLPAPPTGALVQQDGQPYYQPGLGQPLQGPLFSSLVLVAHTMDCQPQAESDTGRISPHVLGREGSTRGIVAFAVDGEPCLSGAGLIDPTLLSKPATVTRPTLPLPTATLSSHALSTNVLLMPAPSQALDLPDGHQAPPPADPIIHPPPPPKPRGWEAAMAAYNAALAVALPAELTQYLIMGL